MTSRARIGLMFCVWVSAVTELAAQVFPNGGFEEGDFSSWAVSYDENPPSGPESQPPDQEPPPTPGSSGKLW